MCSACIDRLPISLPGPAEAQLPLSVRPRGVGKNAYRHLPGASRTTHTASQPSSLSTSVPHQVTRAGTSDSASTLLMPFCKPQN